MEAALARNLNFGNNNQGEDLKMARLKREVQSGSYRVDAERVAEEILNKLRLMKQVREDLANPSDPIQRPELRGL